MACVISHAEISTKSGLTSLHSTPLSLMFQVAAVRFRLMSVNHSPVSTAAVAMTTSMASRVPAWRASRGNAVKRTLMNAVTSRAKMGLCVWMKSIGTINFHVSILTFLYRSFFRRQLIIFNQSVLHFLKSLLHILLYERNLKL